MNIYKQQYSLTKAELRNFGQTLKKVKYTDSYWKEIVTSIINRAGSPNNWDLFFGEYLYYCCDEEERKFIDIYIFQGNDINYTSMHFPLSERGCQEWREEILKNIIGLAMQKGYIIIDIKKYKKDAVLSIIDEV